MSHSPCGPNGAKWRRIAPLNRRLGRLELYSQEYNVFSNPRISSFKLPITMTPPLAPSSRQDLQRMPLRKARLANSISQGVRRNPPDGGTPQFPPHRFQISQFSGAMLASLEMQLASLRIRRLQFSIEKSVQDQSPIRTGAGRAHAGAGRGRRDHDNTHHVAEREH
jgi:hypothetical protein